jgi:hypothetical protein
MYVPKKMDEISQHAFIKNIKVFFSDDDSRNINIVKDYFQKLKNSKKSQSNTSFTIYDTSTGIKKEIVI